jgi:hypothetical protein
MVIGSRLAGAYDRICANANPRKTPIIADFRCLNFCSRQQRALLLPRTSPPPGATDLAPWCPLKAAAVITERSKAVPHAASLKASLARLAAPCGGSGSSSFEPVLRSSCSRASIMDEKVTGKGVPGRWRSVGNDSTACSSEAHADRSVRFSSRPRFGSLTI